MRCPSSGAWGAPRRGHSGEAATGLAVEREARRTCCSRLSMGWLRASACAPDRSRGNVLVLPVCRPPVVEATGPMQTRGARSWGEPMEGSAFHLAICSGCLRSRCACSPSSPLRMRQAPGARSHFGTRCLPRPTPCARPRHGLKRGWHSIGDAQRRAYMRLRGRDGECPQDARGQSSIPSRRGSALEITDLDGINAGLESLFQSCTCVCVCVGMLHPFFDPVASITWACSGQASSALAQKHTLSQTRTRTRPCRQMIVYWCGTWPLGHSSSCDPGRRSSREPSAESSAPAAASGAAQRKRSTSASLPEVAPPAKASALDGRAVASEFARAVQFGVSCHEACFGRPNALYRHNGD